MLNWLRARIATGLFLGAALMLASPPASSFTRTVSPEFKLVKWFITNPSSPQSLPLADISGNRTLYAVKYVFGASGSLDLPNDDAEFEAFRRAFAAYQNVSGSALQFMEESTFAPENRVGVDGKNLIFWDETGATENGGDIPDEEIALTMLTMNPSTGEILEADIRLNGQDYTWSTSGDGASPSLDVNSVALHEIGTLIGLDASFIDVAPQSTTAPRPAMYPLRASVPPRTGLSADDRAGVGRIYSTAQFATLFGTVSGRITRPGGQGIYGAHVVAIDADTGNAVVSALSGSGALGDSADGSIVNPGSGQFTLYGLPPGLYYIAVHPLSGGEAGPSDLESAYTQFGSFGTGFLYELYNTNDAASDAPEAKTRLTVEGGDHVTGINFITNQITPLALTDRSYVEVPFEQFTFSFYGVSYDRFYVHSDGYITMATGSADGSETPEELFSGPPRILAQRRCA